MAWVTLIAADGQYLVDEAVPDAIVMQTVVGLIQTHPDCPIYIEGELLLPEQRTALLHQAKALHQTNLRIKEDMTRESSLRIKEDMTLEEFRLTCGTLRAGYEDLRRQHLSSYEDLRRLHLSSARELGLLVQAHNAAVIEEGIRARFYLHQSLEDIDSVDTSVTVVRARRNLEAPDPRTFAPITVAADLPDPWDKRITKRRKQ